MSRNLLREGGGGGGWGHGYFFFVKLDFEMFLQLVIVYEISSRLDQKLLSYEPKTMYAHIWAYEPNLKDFAHKLVKYQYY